MSLHILTLALFLLPWQSLAVAAPQVSSTSTTTQSPSSTGVGSFPTVTDTEGTGSIVGGVGASSGGSSAGASGGNGGAFQLSTGAVVGIAVACAVVVCAIVALWALWFIAKRRQWTIRETIHRASRRLTGRKNPPTPRTPRAPNSKDKRQATMYGASELEKGSSRNNTVDRSRSTTPPTEKLTKSAKPTTSKFDAYMGRK